MKILDAQSLITSSQQRSKEYQQLREELSDLKKSLEDVSNLGDDFTGQGADSIKAFFNDLALYTETYMNFTEMQIVFFNSIEGKLEDMGLAGGTFVDEHFVENQLEQGIKNSHSIIDEQQRELSGIFAGISDIIHLTPFSSEPVNDQLNDADKVRRETIDAVYKLDHELVSEYARSEPIEQHIKSFYSALMAATGRGKSALPMYYDANKFHESEVYKAHKHIDAEVKTYLRIKKEEAEKRRITELKAKLDKPGDLSMDDYIDIATEVGYENLTSDQKLYYGQLLQAKSQQELGNQVWNVTKGVGVGLYDVGKDFVTGIYDLVVNPAGTVEAVVTAVIHPVDTYNMIAKSISDSYERDMVNGDSYSRAHWVSYAVGTVVTSIFGTKGAGSITKTGVATTKVAVKTSVTKTGQTVKGISLAEWLPYASKHQLAGAGIGKVPYNAVDGLGLKDKLMMMAKSANTGVKVTKKPAQRLKKADLAKKAETKNIEEFISGNKHFDDVVDDYAQLYKETVNSNKPWSWDDTILGGENLTGKQRKLIKEKALTNQLIPNIKVTKVERMPFGFADFKGAGVVEKTIPLPKELWHASDKVQFDYLDKAIGGHRDGMTWHHTEFPGIMELVPFGIHNVTIHNGGRTKGMWADAPR